MHNRVQRFDPQDRPNSIDQPGVSVPVKGDSADSNPPVDPEATIIALRHAPSELAATVADTDVTQLERGLDGSTWMHWRKRVWHWSLAQPHPTGVSNLLSSSAERQP